MRNNDLLTELLKKQLKTVPLDKKFRYNDLKRLCKYINSSIFDENICSLWGGYVTNVNNISKGVYINFYFKSKKAALHRLLYVNFVGNLSDDEYLKFSCEHKGKCCNITHLRKFSYSKTQNNISVQTENVLKNVPTHQEKKTTFSLSFD